MRFPGNTAPAADAVGGIGGTIVTKFRTLVVRVSVTNRDMSGIDSEVRLPAVALESVDERSGGKPIS